jgi:hypothetical protein
MDSHTQHHVPPTAPAGQSFPPAPAGSRGGAAKSGIPESHEKALLLWLQWNDAFERLSESMFRAGSDQQAIQTCLDEADRLRQEAIDLTRELLGLRPL